MKEIFKLVKLSSKRSTFFVRSLENYEEGLTSKPLCPTRWTVSMDRGQTECYQTSINLTLCLVLNLAIFYLELQSSF